MALVCEGGCGKKMGVETGLRRCDACRAKRSRAKKGALPKAYAMGFDIDAWGKMLSEGVIDVETGREIVEAVWDRVYALHEQVKRLEAVRDAKAAEKAQKKR